MINQKAIQTGAPRGTYKRGQSHPSEAGICFKQWNLGREKWQTVAQAERDAQQKADHYRANTEVYKARDAAYRKANPEILAARAAAYYKANPEKRKASSAAYYKANSEKCLAKAAARYKSNPEKHKDRVAIWQSANPGVSGHCSTACKARALGQAPELTEFERDACIGTYAQMQRLNKTFGKGTWEVDHTRPLALGGLHHPSNLQIVPAKWNTSKGSKHSNRWEAPYEKG